MKDFNLDERSRMVLTAVVSHYIATVDPVGSRTLWKKYDLGFSPATLRNIMADLEEMGFLQHPYTSAGRVPTELGYRFYVDSLARQWRLNKTKLRSWEQVYNRMEKEEVKDLFAKVCRLLASTSHYIGVVLAPRLQNTVFKHIDFIRLRDRQVLVVFVSQAGIVYQRVIEAEEDYAQDKLEQMARCLNAHLQGLSLRKVRDKLLVMMAQDKQLYDRLLQEALQLSKEVLESCEEGDVYIDGQLNILNQPEFSDIEKMRSIFQAFEEKNQIVQILDKCLTEKGVQILIGSETQTDQMRYCSLVTATYTQHQQPVGALGVIGPTRMQYSQVIPLVEYAAHLMSQLLNKK